MLFQSALSQLLLSRTPPRPRRRWMVLATGVLLVASVFGPLRPAPAGAYAGSVPSLTGGGFHTLAVKSDGTLWAWGWNGEGELGTGTASSVGCECFPSPVQVLSMSSVTGAAAGEFHSIARRADGTVWAWGDNIEGELGNGTQTLTGCDCNALPTQIAGMVTVTAVGAMEYDSLALKSDGTVWGWGEQDQAQLGSTPSSPNCGACVDTPSLIVGLTGITAISGGGNHGLALKSDGTVWGWGHDTAGQVGIDPPPSSGANVATPTQVPGLTHVIAVAGGHDHSLALKSDGTVWAWGDNGYGELGNDTTTGGSTPVKVQDLTDVIAIAAGWRDSVALRSDGTVWTWGADIDGELGNGTEDRGTTNNTYHSVPVEATGLSGVTAVSSGDSHNLALRLDGAPWVWGFNGDGEVGNGTNGTGSNPNCQCTTTPQSSLVSGVAEPSMYLGAPTAGPSGSELFGAANPGETGGPFDLVAAGVNAVSGNLTMQTADLVIPGRGPGLSFVRTYNSLDGSIGPVGYGWEDSYDARLLIDAGTGNATVTNSNGSTVPFTAPASGNVYGAPPWVTAALVGSATTGWTYTLKNQVAFSFNTSRQLTAITDRNNNQVTIAHNATNGLVSTVTEVGTGRTLTFTYDSLPRLTSVADSTGRSVSYYYDDAHSLPNNLDHVVDANGNTTYFTYNTSHQLLTTTNQDGNVTTFTYATDSSRRIATQLDQMSRQFSFTWLASGVSYTDPRGITTTITTSSNEETTVQRAGTTLWQYGYDSYDNKQTAIDPNGNAWLTLFDAKGNVVETVNPLSSMTSTTYNATNDPSATTDQNGVTTTYQYDTNGNLTSVSTPLNGTSPTVYRTTAYTYDPNHPGDVLTVTDPDSKVWHYTYDQYGDRISATAPTGGVTTYAYDAAGRMTSTVAPKGNCTGCAPANFTTTFTYDNENHQLTAADPLNHQTISTYYPGGKLHTRRDPDGNTTTYAYDGDEELHSITRADNTVQTVNYDNNGNVTSQVSALGGDAQVAYGYDSFDHVNSTTFWDATGPRTTSVTNDPLGNPLIVTDPSSRTTTYGYDAAQRLTSVTYSDHATPNVTFTYYSNGQRHTMADGTGTTTYAYDSLGRLTSVTNGAGAQLQYGYNLRGLVTSLTYPGSTGTVTRGYDDSGRLTSVKDWAGRQTTYGYDLDSNMTLAAFPNSTKAVQGFNNANQMTSISDQTSGGSVLMGFTYGREGDSLLASSTTTGVPGNSETYTPYDPLLRVTQVNGASAYSYDGSNAVTAMAGGETLSYGNPADELSSSTVAGATSTYSFDPQGNRTGLTKGLVTTPYIYDMANRLISTGLTTYQYNGDGVRTAKVSGGITQETTDPLTGLLLQDGTTSYVFGLGNTPLEQVGSTTSFYLTDQLGSVRGITSTSGSVQGTFTYDAYGNLAGSSGAVTTPFGFAGQYRDSETGFYYLRARYYDPGTGQFLSRDPKGGGLTDTYAYAADSPLNATDPSGLAWCPVQALCDFFGGNGQRITDWFAAHSHDVARYTSATLNAIVAAIPIVGEVRLAELGAEAGAAAGETAGEAAASEGGSLAEDAAGQTFRHYTDEVGRAGIQREGSIAPGADGRVYVTTDDYASGEAAQAGLALRRTPTGYFEIPAGRLPGLEGPYVVDPANGQPGGGVEYWVEQAVEADGLTWVAL